MEDNNEIKTEQVDTVQVDTTPTIEKSKLACCIDIVRKLSPSKIEHNVTGNQSKPKT